MPSSLETAEPHAPSSPGETFRDLRVCWSLVGYIEGRDLYLSGVGRFRRYFLLGSEQKVWGLEQNST